MLNKLGSPGSTRNTIPLISSKPGSMEHDHLQKGTKLFYIQRQVGTRKGITYLQAIPFLVIPVKGTSK